MNTTFSEVKFFQVKPDKLDEFENLINKILLEQKKQQGCIDVKYMKPFFTLDGLGNPPRKLTKIVKSVNYYSYWEFDSKENYGKAIEWFFINYEKDIQRLLIMPFDVNLGYSL